MVEKEKHDKKESASKKTKEKGEPSKHANTLMHDPWQTILYPLLTEKVVTAIEKENKLVFIVRRTANKKEIANAVKKVFAVEVDDIKTMIDQKGRKKALVKLAKGYNAGEIATRLGML